MFFSRKDFTDLAYSVAATEHSVMTAKGREGEAEIVQEMLTKYPKGILSVVADSYDIYNFCENIVGKQFKDAILLHFSMMKEKIIKQADNWIEKCSNQTHKRDMIKAQEEFKSLI